MVKAMLEARTLDVGDRRLLRRYTLASYLAMAVALVFVLLLGGWGARRELERTRANFLRAQIGRLHSHAERTVGYIESQVSEGLLIPDLAGFADFSWLREHWAKLIPRQPERDYAAVTDPTGRIVAHSNPALVGRRFEAGWYERVVPDVGADVVETGCWHLTGGRRALDIRVSIDPNGIVLGTYHSGLSTDWLEASLRADARRVVFGWTLVIGGIASVVLAAAFSLRSIGRQTAALQRRLDQADVRRVAELSQLIVGLAHEVRNPLNAVRLNLHAIGKLHRQEAWLADHEVLKVLRESAQEIERVESLMREMLGHARCEPHEAENVDLSAEVRGALELLRQAFDDENVAVETRWPTAPPRVRVDRARLRQVLLNLLNNAREAVGRGGHIEVEAVRGPGCWELIVSDDGPGVPAADRRRIFEPFYSTKILGLGLGLALVKRYVEEAAGSVCCDARPGGGGRFRVRLPAAASPADSRSVASQHVVAEAAQ